MPLAKRFETGERAQFVVEYRGSGSAHLLVDEYEIACGTQGAPVARALADKIERVRRKGGNAMNMLTPYSNGRRSGSLLSWDPLRLFDELIHWQPTGSQTVWAPYASPAKLETSDDVATITVDMPGVDANDVEITFVDGTLAIAGKRGDHTYRYSVALGDAIDPDHIEAVLDKGVLTVHAHKKPEAKPRKIQLTAPSQKSLGTGDDGK